MALGESEPPLDRWPQEGHNSCPTFDSLGLSRPQLTQEILDVVFPPLPTTPHSLSRSSGPFCT